MADFQFRVGVDYAEALRASRSFINAVRSDLTAFQQQARAFAELTGSTRGVGGALAGIQGRGIAAIQAEQAAGRINPQQAAKALADLATEINSARRALQAELNAITGRSGRVQIRGDVRERARLDEAERLQTVAREREAQDAQRAAARAAAGPQAPQGPRRTEAQITADDEVIKARQRLEVLQASKAHVGALGRTAAAERFHAEAVRQDTNRRLAEDQAYIRAKAGSIVAERQLTAAINREARAQLAASGAAGQGSFFQRTQAYIASRQGGGVRLPEEFQSFGQFFTSKALTTAGFAISGSILYGAVSGFREIVKEASELQVQLSIVQAQFDEIAAAGGDLGQGVSFADFRNQVIDISKTTGVAADQVALVGRQLAGVFRVEDTGLPDFNRALQETSDALKLSQVTGLPVQEITDSLTAIGISFDIPFKEIGDSAIALEQRFGVLSTQIIQFTADLAPTGKELGFTADQLAALGAIAQQSSGRAGAALAENFGRILPTIRNNVSELVQLLGQSPNTTQFIDPIVSALSKGDTPGALAQIVRAYKELDSGQRNALATMLGGSRQAQAFFSVLERGSDTIKALEDPTALLGDTTGKGEQRFARFQETVGFAFAQMGRAAEEFGLALFDAGLADLLRDVAQAGQVVATVAAELLKIFSSFNDSLGGIPGKLLAIYAAFKLFQVARGALGGARGALGSILSGTAERAAIAPVGHIGYPAGYGAAATARAPLFTSAPANALKGALGVPVGAGVTAAGIKGALAGVLATAAPVVAAFAVGQLLSTIQDVGTQLKTARQDLSDQIVEKLKRGVSPDEILARIRAAGGDDQPELFGIAVPLFGPNPSESGLDTIQKENAERQGKELAIILKEINDDQRRQLAELVIGPRSPAMQPELWTTLVNDLTERGGLEQFVQDFLNDPSDNERNDAIARIIEFARSGGASPATLAQLEEVARQYLDAVQAQSANAAVDSYAPLLAEVRASYEAGNASLDQLVAAQKRNIELLRTALPAITDPANRAKQLQDIATAEKQMATDIGAAFQRQADIEIRIAKIRGGDVGAATVAARRTQLVSLQTYGAPPTDQLDAALSLIDAEQAAFTDYVNSALTASEKYRRILEGRAISPDARAAVIRASLQVAEKGQQIRAIAAVAGVGDDVVLDAVVAAIQDLDEIRLNALRTVLQKKIDEAQRTLEEMARIAESGVVTNIDPGGQLAAIAAARAALDALNSLPSGAIDPGPTIGTDDRARRDAAEASQREAETARSEARQLEAARAGLERARANGDPVAIAQINVAAAQAALASAVTPSELIAAQTELQEAMNQLNDANQAIIEAQIALTTAIVEEDPVKAAQQRRELANSKLAAAKGEAERLSALAEQIRADRAIRDAINAAFDAQQDLLAAIASAAGDQVTVARIALTKAQNRLRSLLDDGVTGQKLDEARAAVISAQAGVRDAELQTRQRDIDFALQIGQITTQQAIAQLQALLQLVAGNKEKTQEILLKINELKKQLNQDLAFNLPTDLRLPTLYEVRRLAQSATPAGPGGYQDNRQVTVTIGDINNQGDLDTALDQIVSAVSGAPRGGNQQPFGVI